MGNGSAGQRLSNAIVVDVGDLAQTFEQTERLKNAGIDAHADMGVAGFVFVAASSGEVKARSATTAIGSRRRLRASWISAPSLRSARRTAAGG